MAKAAEKFASSQQPAAATRLSSALDVGLSHFKGYQL
jgi:hypothetical protein